MQASSRWDPTRGDRVRACMPGQSSDFHFERWYWYRFFNFDLPEGSQGTSPSDLRYHRENGFGHGRSERSRPQFTAHKSVRPFENGLRSVGSSATRPWQVSLSSRDSAATGPRRILDSEPRNNIARWHRHGFGHSVSTADSKLIDRQQRGVSTSADLTWPIDAAGSGVFKLQKSSEVKRVSLSAPRQARAVCCPVWHSCSVHGDNIGCVH
jgi:hypothetical protein